MIYAKVSNIYMISENDLKIIVKCLSFNFNVVDCEWFYENQLCIIITDNNNVKNHYRIFINTEFNHIYFQYIDETDGEIIDLTDYLISENIYDDDTIHNITILIFSMLNYYMNVLVYSYESE